MGGDVNTLRAIISVTDLARYADNDVLLEYAVDWAVSEVNKRRGYAPKDCEPEYEPQYRSNVIQGAQDWLGRLGGEEVSSFSENGVSASYREIPSWLQSVIPILGTV